MFIPRIVFPILAAVLMMPAFGQVVDEAVKLSAGGVSEDVILAWAERQSGQEISAADIVTMKDAKVSDRVIIALIKGSGAAEAPIATAPRQEILRRDGITTEPEHETVRYVDSSSTEVTPGVELAGYYYPRYYSSYYYPRYYSYGYYPRYYYPRYYSHYYYPRYYGGYYPRYYGGYGYYGRPYYHHRSGFYGGFSFHF